MVLFMFSAAHVPPLSIYGAQESHGCESKNWISDADTRNKHMLVSHSSERCRVTFQGPYDPIKKIPTNCDVQKSWS